MKKRKIIVGDVHGCSIELGNLLKACDYAPKTDQLYLVGDLINKGPDSQGVMEIALQTQAKCVIGNHEYHLLRDAQGVEVKRSWVEGLKRAWGGRFASYLKEIQSWPFYLEEEDCLIVHAGLAPGQAVAETDPFLLCNIRTWDGVGKRLWNHADPAWFELYKGEKLVVFGHWAALEGVIRPNAIGLDTGCVYGKRLTAFILPEKRWVSVAAEKAYCPID